MKIAKLLISMSGMLSKKAAGKLSKMNSVMEAKIAKMKLTAPEATKRFIPAYPTNLKSIKEIKQFNKDRLGIKHFDIDDYDTAKWLTDGLSKFYNKTKGKVKFPKGGFKLTDCKATDGIEGFMGYNRKKDAIIIDRNLISQAKETAKANGESLEEFMIRFGKTKMDGNENYTRGTYQALFHELGHSLHVKSSKNYRKMSRLTELETLGIKDNAIVREFLGNAEIQKTAGKISKYAQCSPNEFVAETFSMLLKGERLPDDVISLYKKYDGPLLDSLNKRLNKGTEKAYVDFINKFGYTEKNLSDLLILGKNSVSGGGQKLAIKI